jgi:hypothetical protein
MLPAMPEAGLSGVKVAAGPRTFQRIGLELIDFEASRTNRPGEEGASPEAIASMVGTAPGMYIPETAATGDGSTGAGGVGGFGGTIGTGIGTGAGVGTGAGSGAEWIYRTTS